MYSDKELTDKLVNLSGWQPDGDGFSLGYLLRKLPEMGVLPNMNNTSKYKAIYDLGEDNGMNMKFDPEAFADTPEDAACKLAIELFKEGILK